MALPPSPMTELLSRSPSPCEMYLRLVARDLLSDQARARPWELMAFIVGTLDQVRGEPDATSRCGPSGIDYLARALSGSNYLNAKGISATRI